LQKFLLAANQYLPRRISITLQKVIHDLNRREKDAVIMFTVANTSKKTSASSRFIQLLRIARLSVPPISEAHKLLSEINYKEKEKIHPLVQKHLKTTRESHSFHFLETPSTLERLDNFNARIG
jgi:hydroxymethylpyrimidine/phosphomethylpyrimidine kinase